MWQKMELVFDRFYQKLYVYALAMLEDEDESKDVVSGVMQTVWEDWNSPSPQMSKVTASILYTSVRNRCLDILRREKVHDRYLSMLEATEELTDDYQVQTFEARIQQVNAAVDRLPERTREILQCTYYKKMTYKQTAAYLGTSENMVRKHMIKAFALLREMLKMVIIWYTITTLFV